MSMLCYVLGVSPDQVQALRAAPNLATEVAISIDIYGMPRGPGSDHDSGLREEVGYYFPQLRDYVLLVAQRQGGLLTWLS